MRIALRADHVFTGVPGELPGPGRIVLVEDGRIAAVGLGSPPEDAVLIDLAGTTLLPGLVDAHSHLSIVPAEGNQIDQLRRPGETQLPVARRNVARSLESGVTTMRVLGQEHDVDFTLQREIEDRRIAGPRLVCAGVQFAKPGGHGHALTAVADEEAIERLGEQNLSRGARVLKIFATAGVSSEGSTADAAPFTEAEIRRAADVAHRHSVLLAAHAHGGEGARRAIAGGVDTIEHGGALDDELMQAIADKRLAVVGTFSILYHPEGIERGDAGSASIMRKLMAARETVERTWRTLVRSGIRLALGTDSMHGQIAFELGKFVEFGASPLEALRAATAGGAEICGVGSSRGRLAPGYEADLVAVRGKALESVACVACPVLVMQQGHVVFRTELANSFS